MEQNELERFEAIVLPHMDAAYTLARYLARNDHDAQDVVQEAYLRALKYFDGFRGAAGGEGRSWLLAIVRNTAYTWRHQHRADALATEFDEELHSETVAHVHPETALLGEAARASLRHAIHGLPPDRAARAGGPVLQRDQRRGGRAGGYGDVPPGARPQASPRGAAPGTAGALT